MRPLFALVLIALLPLASAHHCTTYSTSFAIQVGEHYLYDACVDHAVTGDDGAGQECGWWGPWAVWIYEESNGIPGLQLGDEMGDDTCHGLIEADTVVF